MIDPRTVEQISEHYPMKILEAFRGRGESMKVLETIAQNLKLIFRYFEPAFFSGKFYMTKHFKDDYVFDKATAIPLIDKNVLLDRTEGAMCIQVFDDGKLTLWENFDPSTFDNNDEVLTYFFEKNREYYLANGEVLDITEYPYGSQYSGQFYFLEKALKEFEIKKIARSSCPLFSKAWHSPTGRQSDSKRILFRGASDSPEKPMQESFWNFIKDDPNFRGIDVEANPEFNVDRDKPKPVDFRITWLEANRAALVEMKWVGDSVSENNKISSHRDSRVNAGLKQLKGYWDSARSDNPKKIMKAYLIVIDGRRRGARHAPSEINSRDGFHYQNKEFNIRDNRKYFNQFIGFEEPIRMFAEPICMVD